MDYSLCKALSYNMESIPVALVMYDIMCQYGVHLKERVKKSPELSIPDSLELRTGIGLFHIHGHQDSCLPRFSPSYIPGAKQVDGEIIETLWAPLNNVSQSIQGMSLAHRQEVLDAHMNHSNWKKMVRIGMSHSYIILHINDTEIMFDVLVPFLLKRWKRLEAGMDLSAETFDSLTKRLKKNTKQWLKAEKNAQINRYADPTSMDIYDTVTAKGMNTKRFNQFHADEYIQLPLVQISSRD
jgi:ribosomal protein L22